MNVLFIHQNFPSQYRNIARYYAANSAVRVAVIGNAATLRERASIPGAAYFGYTVSDVSDPRRTGRAAEQVMRELRDNGFVPDLIFAHPAWGEALFVRSVYPDAPLIAYAEQYGNPDDPCIGFDPEFPFASLSRDMEAHNAVLDAAFESATVLQTPTRFQLRSLPERFRAKTVVLHDGIDTNWYCPARNATAALPPTSETAHPDNAPLPAFLPPREEALTLTANDEVVTFFNRTLEPCRGWHTFARALGHIQRLRPQAHTAIVGRTGGGYGPPPPDGGNWRDRLLDEIRDTVDFTRVHFVGNVSDRVIRDLLRVSRAHVYLTYPFFVSYSPLEALSCGAPLIVSATESILEIVEDGKTALAVDFFSPEAVADAVDRLLSDRNLARTIGEAGRNMIVNRYDTRRVTLPRWLKTAEQALTIKKKTTV